MQWKRQRPRCAEIFDVKAPLLTFDRDDGNLLDHRRVPRSVALTLHWWKRRDRRSGGRRAGKVFPIHAVHFAELTEIVDIHVARNHVGKIKSRLFQSIEQIPHGLPPLILYVLGEDAAIRAWNEAGFGRAEE